MENLSEDSVRNILRCLDTSADTVTQHNFRKSSYKMNKVAVNYGYDNVAVVGLAFGSESSEQNSHWYAKMQTTGSPGMAMFNGSKICRILLKTNKYSFRMPLNKKIVQKALMKVKSAEELAFRELTLDSASLTILKEFAHNFRSTTFVNIFKCTVKWTSKELMEFLKIFDHILTLHIGNNDMNPAIVTDKHLQLVLKSISVADSEYDIRPFSGITENICEHWLNTSIRKVFIRSNTSNLTFSSVSIFMEKLKKKLEADSSAKKHHASAHCFGNLRNSNTDLRETVLGQRNRGSDWKILTYENRNMYTVMTEFAQCNYMFALEKNYEVKQ